MATRCRQCRMTTGRHKLDCTVGRRSVRAAVTRQRAGRTSAHVAAGGSELATLLDMLGMTPDEMRRYLDVFNHTDDVHHTDGDT